MKRDQKLCLVDLEIAVFDILFFVSQALSCYKLWLWAFGQIRQPADDEKDG